MSDALSSCWPSFPFDALLLMRNEEELECLVWYLSVKEGSFPACFLSCGMRSCARGKYSAPCSEEQLNLRKLVSLTRELVQIQIVQGLPFSV
jgi:hypothetical protein